MTTDKLTSALVSLLEAVKPDASLTVVDARSQDPVDLPTIAVSIEKPEGHSSALPGVQKCPVTITLRVHSGDNESRATLVTWADSIEQKMNDPQAIKNAINGGGFGLQCDHWKYEGGSTQWNETVFEAELSAEAWVVRTS